MVLVDQFTSLNHRPYEPVIDSWPYESAEESVMWELVVLVVLSKQNNSNVGVDGSCYLNKLELLLD